MAIKRFRAQRGLTQEALAKKAGVHRVYIAQIEGQTKVPSLATLEKLAKARREGGEAAGMTPIVLRSLAVLALVGCSSLTDLSAPQEAQLADFEGCADQLHVGYREMRLRVIVVMLQQGLDSAETVTGLEVVDEIRSGRDVRRMSSADVDFINRNDFLRFSHGGAMGRPWFTGLPRCLEDRHGYKIRTIEIR